MNPKHDILLLTLIIVCLSIVAYVFIVYSARAEVWFDSRWTDDPRVWSEIDDSERSTYGVDECVHIGNDDFFIFIKYSPDLSSNSCIWTRNDEEGEHCIGNRGRLSMSELSRQVDIWGSASVQWLNENCVEVVKAHDYC